MGYLSNGAAAKPGSIPKQVSLITVCVAAQSHSPCADANIVNS